MSIKTGILKFLMPQRKKLKNKIITKVLDRCGRKIGRSCKGRCRLMIKSSFVLSKPAKDPNGALHATHAGY